MSVKLCSFMPLPLDFSSDMEEYGQEVSVVDVYDIASEIGKEFEKIIDAYGTEAVTSLMPKVINALEHLESLATKNERENTTVEDLKARIVQLESDKIEKAEDRHRFEKELEQIEDHWRQESRELVAMVTRLQEENRRLSSCLAEKSDRSPDDAAKTSSPDVDVAVLQRLRSVIDEQREQIRSRDRELVSKSNDVDSLMAQVERLTVMGKELRRKHRTSQTQVRGLIDERADFLAQLQDQHRELNALRQRLGIAQKENEDLSKSHSEVPDLTNKAVYDLDDPNRPRFTTAELKEILHERNELKARVSDLEDELEMYRPKNTESRGRRRLRRRVSPAMAAVPPCDPDQPSPSPSAHSSCPHPAVHPQQSQGTGKTGLSAIELNNLPTSEEEDPPVQGPLPFEPDDAPWKKSESGIRKFFRKLFSESNVTFLGSSPKRSLSSLSKMALSSSANSEATF